MNRYQSFAVTVTGGSHIKHGKGCEDASNHYDDEGVSIAVVADGHGDDNCFRSALGSKFAMACATKGIQEFVKYLNEPEEADPDENDEQEQIAADEKKSLFKTLASIVKPASKSAPKPAPEPRWKSLYKSGLIESCMRKRLVEEGIIRAWFKTTAENFSLIPVTEKELQNAGEKYQKRYAEGKDLHHAYGTTLIAAAITPNYWFGIHIGDGRFTALYADGTYDQPVPWDEKCYLNVTTSICDDDASERARCKFFVHEDKTPPVAVFLCSDGIDDNYPVDDNDKHLFKLYRTIAATFAEDKFESTCKQLKELADQFATKGKGDDTSIAGFIDMEALKQAVPIWQKQIAEEEAAEGDASSYGSFVGLR